MATALPSKDASVNAEATKLVRADKVRPVLIAPWCRRVFEIP